MEQMILVKVDENGEENIATDITLSDFLAVTWQLFLNELGPEVIYDPYYTHKQFVRFVRGMILSNTIPLEILNDKGEDGETYFLMPWEE